VFPLQILSLNLGEAYVRGEEVLELLTEEITERLTAEGGLRSFELNILEEPSSVLAPAFDYLIRFTRLSELSLYLTVANQGSLASILAHLPLLKALELN